MNVRYLLPAMVAAAALVAGTHAVDARPARPHLVTVTAPCSDPLVKIPEADPFRPGGANFSVGTRSDVVEVSC